mmetsp:Transcript_4874/g.13436  ORF Transcript_4874/g.13436 Transcript_4874/m.13436 type:complete len:213 (+) Transcript_4874:852-1490(+)
MSWHRSCRGGDGEVPRSGGVKHRWRSWAGEPAEGKAGAPLSHRPHGCRKRCARTRWRRGGAARPAHVVPRGKTDHSGLGEGQAAAAARHPGRGRAARRPRRAGAQLAERGRKGPSRQLRGRLQSWWPSESALLPPPPEPARAPWPVLARTQRPWRDCAPAPGSGPGPEPGPVRARGRSGAPSAAPCATAARHSTPAAAPEPEWRAHGTGGPT